MDTPMKTTACWSISLDSDCPHCKEYVDLLESSDFWHDHEDIEIGEHNTTKSRNVTVCCPNCYNVFVVDLEY